MVNANGIYRSILFTFFFLVGPLIQSTTQIDVFKFNANKLEIQNGMLVQMDIDQLKQEYPELMNFLYNTSNDRSYLKESSPRLIDNPAATTSTVTLGENSFVYYNSTSKMLEGISMQSTYSIFKLNPYKIFTMITTTSYPLFTPSSKAKVKKPAAPSLIPLYHQFIYSIKIFNYLPSENKVADLGTFLNEQTAEASRIRVHILKTIAEQLNLKPTSLRINWIEKFNNESSIGSAYERILISLSSTELLDMQNSYSTFLSESDSEKVSELSVLYERDCSKYFELLSSIHSSREFTFNIDFLQLMYPNETFFTQNQNYEQVEKVQLLKLCDIKAIYSILSLADDDVEEMPSGQSPSGINRLLPKQFSLANSLIKRSSQEILFENSPIDLGEREASNATEGVTDYFNESEEYFSQVVKLKSDSGQNSTNLTQAISGTAGSEMTLGSVGTRVFNWYSVFKNEFQRWFWSVVPGEDMLVAVVVPAVIVVSLIIFSVVTICILQMCNKDYKEAKKMKNSIQTTDMSNFSPIDKSRANATKERAYLSKGVPVILYEEMSDKPIDEYDENNRDIMDNAYETRNYRSPLIMRNEKPPMPAPPEYSRANSFRCSDFSSYPPLSEESHIIVNELSEESTRLIQKSKTKVSGGKEVHVQSSLYQGKLDGIKENSNYRMEDL